MESKDFSFHGVPIEEGIVAHRFSNTKRIRDRIQEEFELYLYIRKIVREVLEEKSEKPSSTTR